MKTATGWWVKTVGSDSRVPPHHRKAVTNYSHPSAGERPPVPSQHRFFDTFWAPCRRRGVQGTIGTVLALLAWVVQPAAWALSASPWQPPPSTRLTYDIDLQASGFSLKGTGELDWRLTPDGGYQAKQATSARIFFKRIHTEQISEGRVGPAGLSPRRYENRKKNIQVATFDPVRQLATYDNGTRMAWPSDAQDRVSMLIDLGRRTSEATSQGRTQVEVAVSNGRRWKQWAFRVEAREVVQTAQGAFPAWRLVRTDGNRGGQEITLWLAPQLHWLPVKLIIQEAGGEVATQTLRQRQGQP